MGVSTTGGDDPTVNATAVGTRLKNDPFCPLRRREKSELVAITIII